MFNGFIINFFIFLIYKYSIFRDVRDNFPFLVIRYAQSSEEGMESTGGGKVDGEGEATGEAAGDRQGYRGAVAHTG